MNRRELEETIASCTRCHLATPQVAPVPFRGPTPAACAIVGEAPGRTENYQGRPLIGPAGKLLDENLVSAGLDLSTVCYFNVVSCWPNRTPATPVESEIQACREHFENQLALADAPCVLLLGNVALQAFKPGQKIMASRGRWWEEGGRSYLPTLHPAAVLRNEGWGDMFRDDIIDFVRKVQACTSSI